MEVEIADAMLEGPGVLEQVALGEVVELLRRLDLVAHRMHGPDQADDLLLRRRGHVQRGDESDDPLAQLQRLAGDVLATVGDEVLAEAGEEEVELVAAVAFDGVGVQVELDEEADDAVVLALELLEEAAQQRGADALVGQEDLARGLDQLDLDIVERRPRGRSLGDVEHRPDGLHPVVEAVEIEIVGWRVGEQVPEHAGGELVRRPDRFQAIGNAHVTRVQGADFGDRHAPPRML
jgi:hypothetical protein